MNQQTTLFSNEKLMAMIIPLFLEQLLIMLVGMADTLVVSYAGEAAVSGVSLVNQFNTIFIYLFTALASGGAVVISQYIGRKKNDDAGESASQLLSFSTIFSILIAGMVLIGNEGMLRLMFGKVEDSVMHACITYLRISAYSYPALAVYNAGSALFRSIGKTSVTMYLSVISNIINVIGNFIGVFVLRAGVAGVAYPSLIARTFSAVMITVLCFQRKNEVFYRCKWIFRWNVDFMKQILKIAIPNGMENGVFQLVKVALSGIVALFGTYQIAANGVAQSIWSLAALAGVAMGPIFITVIGQCMGNGDADAAEHAQYFVGQSYLSMLTTERVGIANVTFEPGCRNNWHIHHKGGQILLCTAGRGYYQEWGKPAQEMNPGDVINIAPEVKHWHGAAPDSWFSHLAVEVPAEGSSNEWLEPVKEEEYSKLK